jgi:hypothetical protein
MLPTCDGLMALLRAFIPDPEAMPTSNTTVAVATSMLSGSAYTKAIEDNPDIKV